jgi:hypothetical protein
MGLVVQRLITQPQSIHEPTRWVVGERVDIGTDVDFGRASRTLLIAVDTRCAQCNDAFIVFYSDCTYTVEVGWEYHSCQGGTTGEGSQSPYFWREVTCCQDQNPCCASGTGYFGC